MSRPKLRVGIIGTGAIANTHAEAIAAMDDVELAGVFDLSAESAARFAATWNVSQAFATLDELLTQSLDVVNICTPPAPHAAQAIAALDAGLHVVVEKPPARSLSELEQMIAASRRNDRALAVCFQQRSGTAARHVRMLLQSGALGRPLVATCHTLWYRPPSYFEVPWRGKWDTEGAGPTLGLGSHQIDLLAWLLGDWASVNAQLWRLDRDIQTEDVSTAVIAFENGTVASVITSALSPRQTSSIRIDTDRATITLDHVYGHGRDNWKITPAPDVTAEEVASWELPAEDIGSGHHAFLTEVYDALRTGDQLPAVAAEPLRSFEILTAIYSSAAEKRTVTPDRLRDDRARYTSFESPVTDLREKRGEWDDAR